MPNKTTLAQLYEKVKAGVSLEEAIAEIVPGADPEFWRPRVANYDPTAAKSKRSKCRSYSHRRRTFHASSVLALSTTQQAEARGRATVELVERVNDQTDPETVEVTTPTGEHQVLEVHRDYKIPDQLESRPIVWNFGGQIIELEVG